MATRLNYAEVAPEAYRALGRLEYYTKNCGLEISLIELVKIRASQVNRCAYCIAKHTKDARAVGESEQRLSLLSTWRDVPFYSQRERAALEWTEVLTLIADTHVPDEVYQRATPHFTNEELVNLTVVVATINAWNRLIISFDSEIDYYRP